MRFTTISPKEFTEFAAKHRDKSFLQTVEIAKLREKNGWTPYYFGAEESGKLIAATMAVARPTFLGKSTYYIPGGPLLDYEDTSLVNFFFKNLRNYAKSHNGYLLHIEPYYFLKEYDRDGKDVQKNRTTAIQNLLKLGFKKTTPDNPEYLFVLNLKSQSEKDLFASFKQNTRNLISRAEKKGVKVRELKREELAKFKQITESTSERRHFLDKSLDYYENMYDLFAKKDEVKFVVAEVELAADTMCPKGCKDLAKAARSVPAGHAVSAANSTIPIAAAMFMTYGDEVIYLFSGSDEKYMKEYNAQYAIQWYMIKYALKHGFKRYNFYGIQGLPDQNKPGYGIYRFKKGFTTPENGHVIELLGAFELPLSIFYYIHRFLSQLKRN